MTRQIALGIVGLGNVIGFHLDAIATNPRLKLVAVCDSARERAERVGASHGVRVFDDYREMLRTTDFDVLVICLPHHLHESVAVAALSSGKHVLVEKPMAMSLEECNRMLAASHASRRHIVVAEVASFDPGARLTGARFRAGALGRFLCSSNVNIRDYFTRDRPAWYLDPSRSGGGMFANVGVHRLALVRAALPTLTPRFVTASVARLPSFPVEACTHAMVQYEEGGAMTYEQVGYFPRPSRLKDLHHMVFEEGIVSWDAASWELVRRDGKLLEEHSLGAGEMTYDPVYNALVETIENRFVGPSARDYAGDLAIAHAIERSAATHSRIDLLMLLDSLNDD